MLPSPRPVGVPGPKRSISASTLPFECPEQVRDISLQTLPSRPNLRRQSPVAGKRKPQRAPSRDSQRRGGPPITAAIREHHLAPQNSGKGRASLSAVHLRGDRHLVQVKILHKARGPDIPRVRELKVKLSRCGDLHYGGFFWTPCGKVLRQCPPFPKGYSFQSTRAHTDGRRPHWGACPGS